MIVLILIVALICGAYVCSWSSERRDDESWWERNRDRRIFELFRRSAPKAGRPDDVYAEDQRCPLCRLSDGAVFAAFETIAKPNRDLDRSTKPVEGLYLVPEEAP